MTNGEQEQQKPEDPLREIRKSWATAKMGVSPWLSDNTRMVQSNYTPLMHQARGQREYQPNGLPADWDYQQANATNQRGPWGEELPTGALGWNDYGQPYYERTIGGWFKRYFAEFAELFHEEDRGAMSRELLERNKPPDFKYYVDREDDENFWDVLKHDVGVVLQGLKYHWTKAEQSADSPLALRFLTTFAGATVSGLGSVLMLPEQAIKYIGTPMALAGDEWFKDLATEHEEQLRGASAFMNLLNAKVPVIRSGVKFVLGIPAMFSEEYRGRAEEYHQEQIWRMGYTALYDEVARQEFMRRSQAGEDPQLLAWELESPAAEFWGGIVWDPLNYWDATIGKSLKAAKAKRYSYRVFESVTDDLADLGDDLAKAVDSASTVGAATAQRTVFDRIGTAFDNIRNGIDDLGRRRGPRTLTSGGKQFVYGQRASSWLGSALFSPQINGNPDRMGDLILGMAKMAGGGDEIAEGATLLARTGYPVNLALSDAGLQTGIFMRNIMTDPKTGALISADDFIKNLTKGGWDPEKAIEQLQELAGRTLRDVFPNVQEQVAQNAEVLALIAKYGDESAEVAQYLAKYPQAATEVGEITKLLAKGYEATAPLRKLFGSIQGTLYMGMSPAYYIRNKLSNTFHIFVDQGPKAALRAFFTPGAAEAQLKAMLQFIPDAAARGIGPLGSFVDKPPRGIMNYFSQASMATEQGASLHIYNNSVRDTFAKALKPGIAVPIDLLGSSSDEARDAITKLAQRYNGNSEQVLDAVLDAQAKGGYNVARNLLFLSSDDVDELRRIGLWDHMWGAATEETTLEDALARMDDVVRDWGRRGNLAASEAPEVLTGELPPLVRAELDDAIRAEGAIPGRAGRDASDLIRRSTIANRDAISERTADLSSIRLRAEVEIIGNHVAEAMAGGASTDAVQRAKNAAHELIERLTQRVEGQIGEAGQRTATMADDLYAATRNFSDLSKLDDADLADLWRRARELELVTGEFVDMSPQQFRDSLWPGWRGRRGQLWTGLRERKLKLMDGEARSLAEAAWGDEGFDEVRRVFTRSDGVVENARMFDNARLVGGVPHVFYDTSEDGIRAMVYQATTPTTRQAQTGYRGLMVGEVVEGRIANPISGRQVQAYINVDRAGNVVLDERTGRVIVTVSQELFNDSPDEIRRVLTHEMAHSLQLNLPDALKTQADDLFPIAPLYNIIMGEGYQESEFADKFSRFLHLREVEGMNLGEALSELDLERRHGALFQEIIDDTDSTPLLSAMRGTNQIEEVVQVYSPTQQLVRTAYADVLAETSPRALREAAVQELEPLHLKKVLGAASEQELARYEELLAQAALVMEEPASWETAQRLLHRLKVAGISGEEALAKGHIDATMIDALQRAEGDPAKLLQGLIDDAELPANFRLPVMTPVGDGWHSESRVLHETSEEARRLVDNVKQGLRENWEHLKDASLSPQQHRELNAFLKEMDTRMATVRTRAMSVAQQVRDFALHAYPERCGIDLAMGMIWPYQFWHSRTYMRWMERLAYNPGLIAGYFKYRRFLEKEHAGLPDWWKYQMNTNELLGIDAKNPMYFNLEQTLNPLYGLTGVDFTDPRRRVDWLSSTMEDLNKFGPSIWTPYQLALAALYHGRGQEEAASRWAGRLWTGTRAIRDVTALLGFKEGMGIEIDPLVNYFGGGLGPYERGRVGRQFNAMLKEGNYSEAELLDASYNQEGGVWDEAVTRAIHERAPGQIASFFAGAGFKPRSQEDIEADRFYSEMNGLYLMKDNLSPEEYRQGWDDLEARYPFMDALLLSRKGGIERDEALAWNVLGRIPPGATRQYTELVGLDSDILSNFYDNKGLDEMSKTEQMHFVASVLDLSAILDMPDGATQDEWDDVRATYRDMQRRAETLFGDGIWELVDSFWDKAPEQRDDFLRKNPAVEAVLDWKDQTVMSSPMLAAYYTSIDSIEKYFKSKMYEEAEGLYGEDLWDHFEVWGQLKAIDNAAARKYWKDHPQLEDYVDFKADRLPTIAARLVAIGMLIPEPKPPVFREGVEPPEETLPEGDSEAWVRSQVMTYLGDREAEQPPQPFFGLSPERLRLLLGDSGYNLLMDYQVLGLPLPQVLAERLEQLGMSDLGQ